MSEPSTNMELLILAEKAAQDAAVAVAEELREDFRKEQAETRKALLEEVGKQINAQFKAHFGETTPTQHIVQHARLDRLLGAMDRVSENFWGELVKKIVGALLFLVVLGAAFYMGGKQ